MMNIRFRSLPTRPIRVTSGFIPKNSGVTRTNIPAGATRYHDGIDLGRDKARFPDPYGDRPSGDIFAVMDGVVIESAYKKGRGWTVILDHGNKVTTLYQHLAIKGATLGGKFKAGDTIGKMGRTGMGDDMAIHLHFELRVDNVPVDPMPYIRAFNAPPKMNVQKPTEAHKVPVSANLLSLEATIREKYRFGDDTMMFFRTHPDTEEFLRKAIAGEKMSDQTISWLKGYKHWQAVLDRLYPSEV